MFLGLSNYGLITANFLMVLEIQKEAYLYLITNLSHCRLSNNKIDLDYLFYVFESYTFIRNLAKLIDT